MSHLPHPKYRHDIDGLRAIAVLSVVVFHAFPRWAPGGFTGVDVFFVISGFLISTIIFEGLDKGSFSFTEFYARRIKRIFPALILVLAACYAAGWFIFLADEFRQLGQHIVAGVAFVSNFVLWREAGYFDTSAAAKPLLHLWSLGVEEQFYLVWPGLLWLAWKTRFNRFLLIALIAVASFGINVWETGRDSTTAFYSPQTRLWELACGSVLAWIALYRPSFLMTQARSNATSVFGTALLVVGFFAINQARAFPGFWALIPVVGALLVVAAGPHAWLNRTIFSHPAAVWFGLISYPLYLWHWPLLTLARIVEGGVPTWQMRVAAIAVSILVSWLTYQIVEKPIRFGRHGNLKALTFAASLAAVGYVGFMTYRADGYISRFPAIVQQLTAYKYDYKSDYREGSCFLEPEQNSSAFANCDDGLLEQRPTLLLWGDSHAAHLYPGYKVAFGGVANVIQRTAAACPPILDAPIQLKEMAHCKEINDQVFAWIKDNRPSRVVLAARWTFYDASGLDATVDQLKGLGITDIDLIGPVPQWVDGLPRQLFEAFRRKVPHQVPRRMVTGLDPVFAPTDTAMRDKAQALGITYISPKDLLCDAGGCMTRRGDLPMAWDYAHLTKAGSEFLVSQFPKF